jgi:hypothetical protein
VSAPQRKTEQTVCPKCGSRERYFTLYPCDASFYATGRHPWHDEVASGEAYASTCVPSGPEWSGESGRLQRKTVEELAYAAHNKYHRHPINEQERERCWICALADAALEAQKERDRLQVALNNVSGTLVDSGNPVPIEAAYGEAVRGILRQRDIMKVALSSIVDGEFYDLDPDDGLHPTSARGVARDALKTCR